MIAIIDYKAGNLTSVKRALDSLGQDATITRDFTEVVNAERVIFPGVGAAGTAIKDLKKENLDNALREAFSLGKPILGICLGTQIILDKSQENNVDCLGIVKGETKRFPKGLSDEDGKKLKIPHMGWNAIKLKSQHPVFEGLEKDSEFYFVHSYYPDPIELDQILAETTYGITFTSVLMKKNLVAMQFHPEKSGRPGLKILDNFCKWNGEYNAE